MGRPLKQGLDYFPLDVDFFQDMKVRKIIKAQGIRSIPVLICLLSNIYRQDGYYLRWDGDMPFLIAEESGAEEGVVTEVLSKAQQVGFFDAGIFDTYGVLTSRGIQKRFFLIMRSMKRKEISVIENFLLIDPADVPKNAVWYHATTMSKNEEFSLNRVSSGGNSINSGGNSINSGNNPQRKVKESKVKEKEKEKEKEREKGETEETPLSSATLPQAVLDAYQNKLHPIGSSLGLQRLKRLVGEYGEATVIEAIERTAVRGKRTIGYMEGILKRWEANGYDDDTRQAARQTSENAKIAMARRAIEMIQGEEGGDG